MKMHMIFVFYEQDLNMNSSSKTHKEKIQTRTNKDDAKDPKV